MVYTAVLSCTVALCILGGCAFDLTRREGGPWAFRARRFRVWFPLGLLYAAFYCARYALVVANTAAVRAAVGYAAGDFAVVLTAGFWTYALTAPFMGSLSDRLGGRRAVLVSAAGCAATNLLAGIYVSSEARPSLALVAVLYALGMVFQGLGTSSIVKVNTNWYRKTEIGAFSGVFNIMINSGYFLALSVCPLFVDAYGMGAVFLLPGGLLLAVCVLLYRNLEGAPPHVAHGGAVVVHAADRDEDLPTASAATVAHDAARTAEGKTAEGKTVEVVVPRATTTTATAAGPNDDRAALRSTAFLANLGAMCALCWTKDGLLSWAYQFLASARSGGDEGATLGHDTTAVLGFAVTVGGFFGGVLANAVATRCFAGNRAKALLLFALLQGCSLMLFWTTAVEGCSDLVVALFFGLTTTFLLGNYTAVTFLGPAALPASVVATGSGLNTCLGYIASGCSGVYLLSLRAGGGDTFYVSWISSLCAACVALAVCAECARRRGGVGAAKEAMLSSVAADVVFASAPPRNLAHRYTPLTAVRQAGIADEYLRGRMLNREGRKDSVDMQFYQWPSKDTLPRDRLAWRLDDTVEARPFLAHRRNHPDSYFGQNSASRRTVAVRHELSTAAGLLFGGAGGEAKKKTR